MNIILVSPLPPPMGGIATLTERMLNKLSSSEIEIKCVNVAHSVDKTSNNITNTNGIDSILIMCRAISSVFFNCLMRRCDAIHINSSSGNGTIRDYYIEKVAHLFKIPVIIHYHCNLDHAVNKSKLAKKYSLKCFKLAKKIIVLNRSSQNFVKNNGFCAQVIPNGISKELIASNHQINNCVQKAVFTGRVSKSKGCMEIYECAKAYPHINFYLAGLIDDSIEEIMGTLNNIYLLGSLSHDEVIEQLDSADLFIFPSYTEGFSISLLEAMARGVPCVTTNVGANRDMLEDKGGIIIEPQNAQALIDAVEKMSSYEIRENMSLWNINKVKEEYTEEKMFKTFTKIYKSIIDNAQ